MSVYSVCACSCVLVLRQCGWIWMSVSPCDSFVWNNPSHQQGQRSHYSDNEPDTLAWPQLCVRLETSVETKRVLLRARVLCKWMYVCIWKHNQIQMLFWCCWRLQNDSKKKRSANDTKYIKVQQIYTRDKDNNNNQLHNSPNYKLQKNKKQCATLHCSANKNPILSVGAGGFGNSSWGQL